MLDGRFDDKLSHKPVMLAIGAVALVSFAIAFTHVDGVFGHRRTPSASMADVVTGFNLCRRKCPVLKLSAAWRHPRFGKT